MGEKQSKMQQDKIDKYQNVMQRSQISLSRLFHTQGNISGIRALLLSLLLVSSIASCLLAQNREIFISRTDKPPKIDGHLDDPVWQTCVPYSGFIQYDPFNGEACTESTRVMLTYDINNLYLAFKCYDSQPSQIKADLTPREGFSFNDQITLILDTFYDKRTSYSFKVNPKGVQKDSPGDYLWESAARITPDGWITEIRIPFKSFRFPIKEEHIWGINFERYIFRLKETDYFTRVGRDDVLLEKSAVLKGLSMIRGGRNLEVFPYAGFRDSRSIEERETKFAGGVDIKYALTSELNLDMRVSPDFSEVESDPFFYQLTPYEYYLSELRPFFQEVGRYLGVYRLFYSKRINDPKFAAKLTGKQGNYTIGAVGAINKEEPEDDFIGACRVQRDILRFSTVGAMFSGYKSHDFENINGGLDLYLKFSEKCSWGGNMEFSRNSDLPKKEIAYYKTYFDYYPDQGWNASIVFELIENNFQPRAGFVPIRDRQCLNIVPGYQFRVNKWGIKQLAFNWVSYLSQTTTGKLVRYQFFPLYVYINSLKDLYFGFYSYLGRWNIQLLRDGELYWSDANFLNRAYHVYGGYTGSRFYSFHTNLSVRDCPVYNEDFTQAFDGRVVGGDFSLALHPTPYIRLNIGSNYTRQSRKETDQVLFKGAITTFAFNWQLTRHLLFRTSFQHDSHNDRMKVDALLGVELGMGNTLMVSYKSKGAMPLKEAITEGEARSFVVKASYLFRF